MAQRERLDKVRASLLEECAEYGESIMAVTGWVFDPNTGARHAARIEVRGAQFIIETDDLPPQTVNPEKLKPVEKRRGTEIYALHGVTGWRLGLTDIDDRLIEARLPEFTLGAPAGKRGGGLVWLAVLALIGAGVGYAYIGGLI